MYLDYFDPPGHSPLGRLTLVASDEGLTRVEFSRGLLGTRRAHPLLERCRTQLAEYFAGTRQAFDLPLAPAGTTFQQTVWKALGDIPFGETRGYGDIAAQLGKPTAARAIGMASGRNPLAIIVPCHRVIGANGRLTGYAGGLERKQWLLAHESGEPSDKNAKGGMEEV
ncbi:methylated-DNA--[protein]-cysteine S-methyltransferase [Vreelandella jeotgali]|uniref:methylated-DNA--[protein]-cysteine S-methyltransferase n=1 Tax=Vreelandella jeotgali TaxID=553386 RepID=UPI00034B8309|nr:methylated-DNA--[protein]-cysteine S-methyltransferase [Halomonas jeotgali]